MSFKFSVVVLLGLMMGACQREPEEVVDVGKLMKCWASKRSHKTEDCSLNDAEKQALACLTSKDSSKKCADASLNEMQFLIEREGGPAKQRGTHFNLSAPTK
jgi:hypothetical protein